MTINHEVDIEELRQVASWLAAADIEFAEIRRAGATIRLTLGSAEPLDEADAFDAPPSSSAGPTAIVRAPSTGVFVATHPDRATPQAAVGSRVDAGSVVGLLQIAELYRPVVAASGGVISAVLAEAGDVVGYGTPLFELAADTAPQTLQESERANDGN
jgi:acetyl-CoA carboxylase biotin carboxyl carrier protein